MPVYVDNARIGYGRMKMSHMIADTPQELHAMAARIGMRRAWFQPWSFPHYDVCVARRAAAIELGAVQVDRRGLGEAMRRIKSSGAFKDGAPDDVDADPVVGAVSEPAADL